MENVDTIVNRVFTNNDEVIDASVNNLNVSCITSKNNSFSVDSDGNIVANSVTLKETPSSSADVDFDTIYPVGSVYLSVNNVNPSAYFGGVWEQITGYYLYAGASLGVGGSNTSGAAAGSTGSTVLTTSQIPSHAHSIPALSGTTNSTGAHYHDVGLDFDGAAGSARYSGHSKGVTGAGHLKPVSTNGNHTHTVTTTASTTGAMGSGVGHTHTLNNHTHTINPPYYNLFVYKRIS